VIPRIMLTPQPLAVLTTPASSPAIHSDWNVMAVR
jgi:hypothetical protein